MSKSSTRKGSGIRRVLYKVGDEMVPFDLVNNKQLSNANGQSGSNVDSESEEQTLCAGRKKKDRSSKSNSRVATLRKDCDLGGVHPVPIVSVQRQQPIADCQCRYSDVNLTDYSEDWRRLWQHSTSETFL